MLSSRPGLAVAAKPRRELRSRATAASRPRLSSRRRTPSRPAQLALGPFEFRTEKWEAAYIRRVDATMAALKSAGVPVLWVGLPSSAATKASSDSSYLNEIYPQPRREGRHHLRRRVGRLRRRSPAALRRKDRTTRARPAACAAATAYISPSSAPASSPIMSSARSSATSPIAPCRSRLPVPVDRGRSRERNRRPSRADPRSGRRSDRWCRSPPPRSPLRKSCWAAGARRGAATTDPVATRVLTKGEPVAAPTGRADDFSWPRGSAPVEPVALQPSRPGPLRRSPARRNPAAQPLRGGPAQAGGTKPTPPRRRPLLRLTRAVVPGLQSLPGPVPLTSSPFR